MGIFKELYAYREMLRSLVHRDLRGRYKGSVLGFLWTFLNPLLQLAVYTILFSHIIRMGIHDYYLFLFVALIPWMFFSSSIMGGSTSILSNQSMVTKIYFPREVLPISVVTGAFVNMLYCFIVVLAVVLVFSDHVNFVAWLYLPVIAIIEYVLALGFALIAAAVTVYIRDLEHILGIVTMAWQFLTPVMYGIDMVPDEYLFIFNLNPMSPIIVAYRDILYYGRIPHMETLISALVFGILFAILGFIVFGRLKRNFAEEL
ncbi:ABC transporter permease [Dialister succinatiphilus]|uniref:ABC transporter permease n=1 Tax=Dialister succinatiphilus TaxID=487173 RepID=UPI0040260548